MQFQTELVLGTLVKRYKRFLADVVLKGGERVTAHVANTGSMRSTNEPGSEVALSYSPNPKRKLKWTLELIRMQDGTYVGVNTMMPNRVVAEAIAQKKIPGLKRYRHLRREVPYGTHSRIDILLEHRQKNTYIEVKNVTYKHQHRALFPDAVTSRGTKHLLELAEVVKTGHRGIIFFLVNRADCKTMGPAWEIDPLYAKTLVKVVSQGVEAMAYQTQINLLGIEMGKKIPKILSP